MNTALIGLGRMGLRHYEVLQRLKLDVVGAADLNADTHAAAKDAGIAEAAIFTDAADMLEAVDAELVVIATTGPSHYPLVKLAVEAGAKNILCEKPMGVSLAQCDAMIEMCEAAGCRLAINHQMRFMDQYVLPKQKLDSEAHGGLSSMTVLAGNFGFAMNGSHYLEAFRYMADDAPATVCAWFSDEILANPRGAQFEDRAGSMRIETVGGKRYYMDIGTDQGHGMHVTYMSRNGRIDIDELAGHMREVVREAEHRDAPTTRYGMPYHTEVTQITPADAVTPTQHVLQALLAGENYPDGHDGRQAIELLVAAYMSAEQGGAPVDIRTAEFDRERKYPWA